MIGINEKEAAEKTTEREANDRHKIRMEFWGKALEALRASKSDLYNNISPSKDHWLSAASGVSGCPYNLIFGVKFIRVEMQIAWGSQAENKFIYDYLLNKKQQIDEAFGHELSWERLNDKISSYIRYGMPMDGDNRDNWPEIINWMIEHIIKLEAVFKKTLADAYQAMKKAGIESGAQSQNKSEHIVS